MLVPAEHSWLDDPTVLATIDAAMEVTTYRCTDCATVHHRTLNPPHEVLTQTLCRTCKWKRRHAQSEAYTAAAATVGGRLESLSADQDISAEVVYRDGLSRAWSAGETALGKRSRAGELFPAMPALCSPAEATPTCEDGISTTVPCRNEAERAWVVMCVCGERMCYHPPASSSFNSPYYKCPRDGCGLAHGAHASPGRFSGHSHMHEEGEPLGVPCDEETKRLRSKVHASLDALWMTPEQRGGVYRELASRMGLPPDECHIARFGRSRCLQALCLLQSGLM